MPTPRRIGCATLLLTLSWSVAPCGQTPGGLLSYAQLEKTVHTGLPGLDPALFEDPDAQVGLGPQDALYVRLGIRNVSPDAIEVPHPSQLVELTVLTDGQAVPITVSWELGSSDALARVSRPVPDVIALGPAGGVETYLIARRATAEAFPPGAYELRVAVDSSLVDQGLSVTRGPSAALGPGRRSIRLVLGASDTDDARYQRLRTDALFVRFRDPAQALEWWRTAVTLPRADIFDRYLLGTTLASLGRHAEAVDVYRPIVDRLIERYDNPGDRHGQAHPLTCNTVLRRVAASYLAVGDEPTATLLLRAEGERYTDQHGALLTRLRESARGPLPPVSGRC